MKRRLLALLMATMVLPGCAAAETAGNLTLLALNVGKADCLLLESGGCVYMIDTGTAESWGAVSSALRQLEIRRLDGVILTHTDKDHAGGLWVLAQSGVEVGGWYASAYYEGVKEKKHPAVLAAALRGETVTWLKAGDELPLPGGRLRVIGPMSPSDKENNNSLVLVAEEPQGRMLLAGDMELPEEQELLKAGAIPPCEVLKVGNHAENDATGAALVEAVSPQVAVISTNSVAEPDTPSPRVLSLLRSHGAQVFETQSAGLAVYVTLADESAQAQYLSSGALPEPVYTVDLRGKSAERDRICVASGGWDEVDLSGWYLYSERGKETFVFPEGTVLSPGQELTVVSLSSEEPGDLVWPEEKVWHSSKEDAACLYDAYGRLISRIK